VNAFVYVLGVTQVLANVVGNFDGRWCEGLGGGGGGRRRRDWRRLWGR
jgi:hypothetical protein